eukprot:CAMPEP_0202704790 /NCGR_PEP_ID=MMETSP1385-20130828/17423_1 /ASSEMBLY_ACC=CAM_ASM_000861 /TAXON_ID=933848 /ORGANISM="Elphidium margaritaceum" /LENGTH=312 /DNA_ID=CAMNT_0049362895 /DNA_START=29 /DNA_END=967 /DNA_ORIENTATION=-
MTAISTSVSRRRLSFDSDLLHAHTPVLSRLQNGAKSLDGVLDILRMRVDAETQFCSALQKIISCSTDFIARVPCTESLRADGLDALYSDMKNEYTQRMTFLAALKEDVHTPLVSMKEYYYAQNRHFSNQSKQNIQMLKKQQSEFSKLKVKYDKVVKNHGSNHSQSAETLRVNNNTKLQQLQAVKQKFIKQQNHLRKQQQIFDNKMVQTLSAMEANEYKRMNALRDGITNWSAFIANLAANRSYDIQHLAKSMAYIDVERDLQNWMKHTLQKYPKPQLTVSQKQYSSPTVSPQFVGDDEHAHAHGPLNDGYTL